MKAVILAAGLGSRLRPITNDVPKCMVSVNGIPIIDKQILNLVQNGIKDICVVSGYKGDVLAQHLKLKYPFVTIINNARYSETNNMYSLYLARDFVNGREFLLMNADVFFDAEIVAGMLNGESCSKIACDKSQFLDESMKITVDSSGKVNHISKKIGEHEHFAVSIDVYRISADDGHVLFSEIEDTIVHRMDEKSWTEVALDMIFDKTHFYPYLIDGRWFEIDNHDDLEKAEHIFKGDRI